MTTDNTTQSPYFLALDVLEDEASYERLQEYQATTTPQLYLNNTKMARVMKRERYEFNELITVGIGGQLKDTEGNQRAGQVAFAIYPPQEAGTEPRELDGDDFHIYDIVSTLVLAGNNFLTASMIDRAMNGVTGTKQVSETRQREIRERLEYMQKVQAEYKFGEHFTLNSIDNPAMLAELDKAPFLNFIKGKAKINGALVEGYFFPSVPVLHQYASTVKQIISIENRLLNLNHEDAEPDHRASNTRDRRLVNIFVIEQIRHMKQSTKRSRSITLSSIFQELERVHGKALTPKMRRSTQENLKSVILPQLVDKGEIKAFEIAYHKIRGKNDTKIKIIL